MSEISVRKFEGEWQVWLDAMSGDFQGAVIGVGRTEHAALESAMDDLDNRVTDLLNRRERTKTSRHVSL